MKKEQFIDKLKDFVKSLTGYVSTQSKDWNIKGFIDTEQNIYTISQDTKIISKLLEIQLFPKFEEFANTNGFEIVLAEKQNWYPDMSFVSKKDNSIKYALDIKTTYRLKTHKGFCNGFTLGSHGAYFRDRTSNKNVQFPYGEYKAHICLGILYTRTLETDIDETVIVPIQQLQNINSVIKDIEFFVVEKWKIASDKSGSGNTANIGSINCIEDILIGNGVFANLGEHIFDEYWINQGVMQVPNPKKEGTFKKLTSLKEYLKFKEIDENVINISKPKRKTK
jgi:hypothetical protein